MPKLRRDLQEGNQVACKTASHENAHRHEMSQLACRTASCENKHSHVMRKLHVRLPVVENKHVDESSHVGCKTASGNNILRIHAKCRFKHHQFLIAQKLAVDDDSVDTCYASAREGCKC